LLIGLSSYVPNFAQGVLGASAVVAGFVLGAMTLGWPLSATFSGRIYLKIGFRNTALIGSVTIVAGALVCAVLSQYTSIGMVAVACFIMGAGLGLMSAPSLVAVQSVVGWDRRGVVTGTNMFFRSIGSAIGAAVFGAIANTTLDQRFSAAPPDIRNQLGSGADATNTVLKTGHAQGAVADYVRTSLYDATHNVFVALTIVAVLGVAVLFLMPRRTAQLTFD
jgi:MFS family permease